MTDILHKSYWGEGRHPSSTAPTDNNTEHHKDDRCQSQEDEENYGNWTTSKGQVCDERRVKRKKDSLTQREIDQNLTPLAKHAFNST